MVGEIKSMSGSQNESSEEKRGLRQTRTQKNEKKIRAFVPSIAL
jgi:hypothetical protein